MVNSKYSYIKSPEDRIYLRLGNLIRDLMEHTSKVGNLEAYAYLRTIQLQFKPEDTEEVIRTQRHITSPNFLNQRCFKEADRNQLGSIIREYKLEILV
jgi:hypothetical protein